MNPKKLPIELHDFIIHCEGLKIGLPINRGLSKSWKRGFSTGLSGWIPCLEDEYGMKPRPWNPLIGIMVVMGAEGVKK